MARVVPLPPAVLEAVRALAQRGSVGEVARDELDAFAETGELPACLAGSSAPDPHFRASLACQAVRPGSPSLRAIGRVIRALADETSLPGRASLIQNEQTIALEP